MPSERPVWPPAAPEKRTAIPLRENNSEAIFRLCPCGARITKKPGRGRWATRCAECRKSGNTSDEPVWVQNLRDLIRGEK